MNTHTNHELLEDDEGGFSVEYVVILFLIAVFAITAWTQWERAVTDDARNEYQSFGYPPG